MYTLNATKADTSKVRKVTLNHYKDGRTGLKKGKEDGQHKKSNRRDEVGRVAAQCIVFEEY